MLTNNFVFSQKINLDNNQISNQTINDSIVSDSIPKKNSMLDGIVNYKAKDITSINPKTKQIYLYNEAQIQYQDMDIQSGVIVIDYGKDLVYAGRLKDSSGIYSQSPILTQGQDIIEPDSIVFNTKTKKALIWNSKLSSKVVELFLIYKKENDSVYYVKRAKFTTSTNEENPEYYFLLRKLKLFLEKSCNWTN